MTRHMRTAIATIALLASGVAACARNPVTGQRQFVLMSEGQEIQMGQEAAAQVERSLGLVPDSALQQYVRGIGLRLAAKSERPKLPWRFGVIDDPTPNAFALPGGPVYITRGLLALLDSEAELASVLGHEIGHITARHGVTQMSRSQLTQLGLGVGMVLVPELQPFGDALGTGMQLLFLKYGRDDERQSDQLGFRYALSENYDVSEMDDVFAALARASESEDEGSIPTWLSTHPAPQERIVEIGKLVAAAQLPATPRLGRTELLNHIDGLVYGEDPRQGFFRDGLFLHPDLRFQLRFPRDWRTQNLPDAVVAVSPNQDAVVQLSFDEGDAATAANRFFSQQGLQAGRSGRETINGNPAVVGYFQAQTQQGVVAGIATFLTYNGRTYRLLSYTPSRLLDTYDATFRGVMNSFARLTDPTALNVKPKRIDLVRLESAMSLTTFNQRYPSTIPLNEVALINQVTDTGARLPAGTLVKRVN